MKHTRPTTPGADNISIKFLRQLSLAHLRSLLQIYNDIFDSGNIPPSWKIATVLPIRKPGKPANQVSSYRPIALTPVLCKLLERMLLRRLLSWGGQRRLYHPHTFGFLPTRDCTLALCTFLNDILSARDHNHYIVAVCLDIKAAYDSVCPELLIYKLASMGLGGKTGRFLANFVKFRYLRIKWKNLITHIAQWYHGVPQGSVLSPFLFLLYLLDIVEVLEPGVYLIIYADDVLIYVIDPKEDQARHKLQNTLLRLNTWCRANELTIEPTKCSAINFTRCRDPGRPIHFQGADIPWSSSVKILGIWFTRSLSFSFHFQATKLKCQKKLNFIKAVTSKTSGITSSHMLRIINATIRSTLEYGAPLFFDAPPTVMNTLEVCYNAALRVATGLPMWTPIPVLRREAAVPSISSRLSLLTKQFLVRLLSSEPGLHLDTVARQVLASSEESWKWWNPLEEIHLLTGNNIQNVMRFTWTPPPETLHFTVTYKEFNFQSTQLSPNILAQEWFHWFHSLPPHSMYATDASKDDTKTSIACVDVQAHSAITSLVRHSNSIFTAEAQALLLALTSITSSNSYIIILSDSLSALRALENWSIKSPTVILKIINAIHVLNAKGLRLHFVWCPGHRGIPPNEYADFCSRYGPFGRSLLEISSEDVRSQLRKDWKEEVEYSWISCKYAMQYAHLLPDRSFPRWVRNRTQDVTLARWRSRTLITCAKLYRMNLSYTPLCSFCFDPETPEHILLTCPRLAASRRSLFLSLHIAPPFTYSTILTAAFSSSDNMRHFLCFSTAALD